MDNKILIVVDVQNGFIKTFANADMVNKITNLAESNKFDKVIATKFINYTDSMFEKCFNWSEFKTPEQTDLSAPLEAITDEVFTKTTYNCVNDKFIELLIQLNNDKMPEKVYLCGLDTDACVLATAIGLFEHNIVPVVLENYCFSTGGEQYHKAGIKCLERTIGRNQIQKLDM